jgi:hypothetical protein
MEQRKCHLHSNFVYGLREVEKFSTPSKDKRQADQKFWQARYSGKIPWQRETITPASWLRDGRMRVVFDGRVQ